MHEVWFVLFRQGQICDYEALQPSGSGFLAVFVKTNCDAPYPSTNPLCAPASSNTTPTTNTNPTDVFSASLP